MDCNISKIGEEYQAIIEDKTDYIPKFELDELKIPDSPFDRSGVRYESTHQI